MLGQGEARPERLVCGPSANPSATSASTTDAFYHCLPRRRNGSSLPLSSTDESDDLARARSFLPLMGRLQDSNAVLSHFNEYSERCYAELSGDFTRNVRLLKSMKSDLDHIFAKLRCAPSEFLFLPLLYR
ncbi:hypothetical protein BHE74_00024730 [Ensete ventricosum]|nr:hypothetical protein BHE74_00024730 [Ensete ventricosum]